MRTLDEKMRRTMEWIRRKSWKRSPRHFLLELQRISSALPTENFLDSKTLLVCKTELH